MLDVDHDGFRARLQRMIDEDRPRIESMQGTLERMDNEHYTSLSISELLDEFEAGRRESCAWLATLTEEQLAHGRPRRGR